MNSWRQICTMQRNIKEVDGKQGYWSCPVESLDNTTDYHKVHVLADLDRLKEEIKQRLEWTDVNLLQALLVFRDTQQRKDYND